MTRLRLLDSPIFRPILLSSAIFGLSACVMFGVMYGAVTRFMERQVDAQLQADIRLLAESDSAADPARLAARLERRIEKNPDSGIYYLLEDAEGAALAGDLPPMAMPIGGAYDLPAPPGLKPDHDLRAYGQTLPNGLGLLMARDTHPQDQVADLMERTFGVGVFLTLAASLGSGAIVSRRLLRRIEELMDGVRQVTDNIAHDMRTPLTRLRHHLEKVRMAGHSVEEFQNAVDIALLETDGVLETFGALLHIAEIEARAPGSGLQPVDLSALCAMIGETYGPVAEAEGHRLTAAVVPALTVDGDRQLLTQMLVNLVENAVQHNQRGTEIRLLLKAGSGGPELSVTDDGVGIPPQERENVLKRFYRVDAARSSQGSGLGLSLVAVIARYHGAALTLSDNGPGLAVKVGFPLAAPKFMPAARPRA